MEGECAGLITRQALKLRTAHPAHKQESHNVLGVDETRIQMLANRVIHEQHRTVSRLARQQRAVSGARTLRLGAAGCRALEDHLRLGGAWCDAVDGHVAEAARAESCL